MSGFARRTAETVLGVTLARWLAKPIDKGSRLVLGLLGAVALYVWVHLVMLTGSVRLGSLLLVLLLVGGAWVAVSSRYAIADATLARARRRALRNHHDGTPPHVLYHWEEPINLPLGLTCACGKPRTPGETIYDGESNDVARRHAHDDDRLTACWFVPGIVGTMETYESAALAKAAERRAIARGTRENIAHARARR